MNSLVLTKKNQQLKSKRINKINEEILADKVRVIDSISGTNEIMSLSEALNLSRINETDLVEIVKGDVPVVRLIDYDKYAFQQEKAKKKSSKNIQKKIKEIKLHSNIASNDLNHKINHAKEFLEEGHKVQFIIQLRGRENSHSNLGYELMDAVTDKIADVGKVDVPLKHEGNNMRITFAKK